MFRRILMNAADPDATGSGGGVSATPPSAAPAPSTPASPPTIETIVSMMDDPKTRDSFFATMRRTGRLKGDPTKAPGTETTTPDSVAPPPAAKTPETEMVSRADLARERAFNRSIAIHGQGLTASQMARMERAFEAEKPGADTAGEWVAGYIADLGLTKPTVAATTVTPPAPPVNTPAPAPPAPAGPPVTGIGAPASSPNASEAVDFINMKPAERDAMIERIGLREFNSRAMAYAKNVKVVVGRR